MNLALLCVSAAVAVGPDLTARDRLVKDLPNGVFAGKKLTPKVKHLLPHFKYFCSILFQLDVKTVISMHLSVRSIDLGFKSGTFKLSGMMSLEWKDPRFEKGSSLCLTIFQHCCVKVCLGPV